MMELPPRLQSIDDRPCHLYRHFDTAGVLLYVGISLSTLNRLAQHKTDSHWFEEIARIEIERHPSRAAALAAERKAIANENPRHNLQRPPAEFVKEITKADISRAELIRRVVAFNPLYTVAEVAKVLGTGDTAVKRLIGIGQIGYIELPPRKKTPHWKTGRPPSAQIRVTGWQLIEYLEHLSGAIIKAAAE
jgi:hypothetical protein